MGFSRWNLLFAVLLSAGSYSEINAAIIRSLEIIEPDSGVVRGIDSTFVVKATVLDLSEIDSTEVIIYLAVGNDSTVIADTLNQNVEWGGLTQVDAINIALEQGGNIKWRLRDERGNTPINSLVAVQQKRMRSKLEFKGDADSVVVQIEGDTTFYTWYGRIDASVGTISNVHAVAAVIEDWKECESCGDPTHRDTSQVYSSTRPENPRPRSNVRFNIDGDRPAPPHSITAIEPIGGRVVEANGLERMVLGLGDSVVVRAKLGAFIANSVLLGDSLGMDFALLGQTYRLYDIGVSGGFNTDPLPLNLADYHDRGFSITVARSVDTMIVYIPLAEGQFPNLEENISAVHGDTVAFFIVDRAGNRNGSTADSRPEGATRSVEFLLDTQRPEFDEAVTRPTGGDTLSDGTIHDGFSDANPLQLSPNETLDSLYVEFVGASVVQLKAGISTPSTTDRSLRKGEVRIIDFTQLGNAANVGVDSFYVAEVGGGNPIAFAVGNDGPDSLLRTGFYTVKLRGRDLAGNMSTDRISRSVYIDVDEIELQGLVVNAARDSLIFALSEPARSVVFTFEGVSGADQGRLQELNLSGSQLINIRRQAIGLDFLSRGSTYEITGLSQDLAGNINRSRPYTFLFDRPVPELVVYDGGTVFDDTLLALQWGDMPAVESYVLEYGRAADFSVVTSVEGVLDNTYAMPTLLESGTTYYWRVKAIYADGYETEFAADHFVVKGRTLLAISDTIISSDIGSDAILRIPVWAMGLAGRNIVSAEVDLSFNGDLLSVFSAGFTPASDEFVLSAGGHHDSTVLSQWYVDEGQSSPIDTLRFVMASGAEILTNEGTLFTAQFRILGWNDPPVSQLALEHGLFNGVEADSVKSGSVRLHAESTFGVDGVLRVTRVSQPGDTLAVQVVDSDLNTRAGARDTVRVRVVNMRTGEAENLLLRETEPHSGMLYAMLYTELDDDGHSTGDNHLDTAHGDVVEVTYVDEQTIAGETKTISVAHQVIGLFGDADGSGAVNALDASEIIRHVLTPVLTDLDSLAANVDMQAPYSPINLDDAALVLRYWARRWDHFPVQAQISVNNLQLEEYNRLAKKTAPMGREVWLQEREGYWSIMLGDRGGITSGDLYLYGPVGRSEKSPAMSEFLIAERGEGGGTRIVFAGPEPSHGMGEIIRFYPMEEGGELELGWATFNGGHIPGHVNKNRSLPFYFAIYANAPNPFNAETVIRFDLPRTVDAKLQIYDLLGQSVRTLLDGSVSAGKYEIVWDGRGEKGQPVASGMYLYRLNAGAFSRVRRMMLIK